METTKEKSSHILVGMYNKICMGTDIHLDKPEFNNKRRRYENDRDRYFQIPERPKIKFIEAFKFLLTCLLSPEGFVFSHNSSIIYISSRKTKINAWKDFIANYWYLKSNKKFRQEIWEEYVDIMKKYKEHDSCDVK